MSKKKKTDLIKSPAIGSVVDTSDGVGTKLLQKGEDLIKSHEYVRHTPETIVPDSAPDIVGSQGGACVSDTETVTARNNLRCPQMHTYKPGEKIFMRHGTTICPKCEMRLERYIPFGEEYERQR